MVKTVGLETIIWDDKKEELLLLDQRVVPDKVSYVRCRTYRDVAEAIRNMTVRGAPAIGVAAAFGIALAALKSKAKTRKALLTRVQQARTTLSKTRPTAVNLFWALDRMTKKAEALDLEPIEAAEQLVEEAKKIMEEDVRVNKAIGRLGAELIPDGARILTHCN
ncbi:MAG: hypothetical protein RMH74_08465 [Candidatus Caldarchaeum sp.]|nr:hypothetical protein [Candidatus Caldarchaeum sp.]